MRTLRSSLGTWAIALATILAVGGGCEPVEDTGASGLLGKVGSSLGGFEKGGRLSIEGAARGKGSGEGTIDLGRDTEPGESGSVDEPTDATPAPNDGSLAAECAAACESIFSCVFERCPALGTPDIDDLNAVVADCAAECGGLLNVEAAASVRSLSCGAVWDELTAVEPELADVCSAEGSYDYDYDVEFEGELEWGDDGSDDDWDDDGWDDDGWDDDGWDDDGWDDDDWDDEGWDEDCDV